MSKLHSTRARLRTSITLRAYPDIESLGISKLAMFTASGITMANGATDVIIGQVKDFKRTQTRGFFKRYSLGLNSMEPFQVVPGQLDTKLSLKFITLYKSDLLKKIFGFRPEHLMFQMFPFTIVEEKRYPDGSMPDIVWYTNCWFVSNPVEYDIDASDQWIVKECDVQVGQMIVYDGSVPSVAMMAGEALGVAGETVSLIKKIIPL